MSDQPFILRGGDSKDAAIHNRIAVLDRIQYLSGVDLRTKSAEYLKALDLELWHRWYRKEPANTRVSEEFCQRAAQVIMGMEEEIKPLDPEAYAKAKGEHDALTNAQAVDGSAGGTPVPVKD